MQAFWNKVAFIPFHSCWEWIGSINKDGYGNFWFNKKCLGAHRVSWQIHFGKIPDNLHVLHRCDNPSCVNPDHLFIGTNSDNCKDKSKKGRINGCKNPNSILNDADVIKIKTLNKEGLSKRKISKIFGVHESHIGKIINGQKWKHIV